jgi:hypothetical protein
MNAERGKPHNVQTGAPHGGGGQQHGHR